MKRLIIAILAAFTAISFTGCAAIVASQLRGKLPSAEAEEVNLVVNIVGAGGGEIHATGISTKGGKLIAASYEESITTGGGSYHLDAKGVDVARIKAKK